MLRSVIIGLFLFISIFYIAFPVQARFIQPEWGSLTHSVSRKLHRSLEKKDRLLEQYRRWKGVRYRWGGTDAGGIDCSALTQKIYSSALHKQLPRTTEEQIKEGNQVTVSELQPGDLIFFRPKESVRHVGVYMGNHQFMHASSSQGVTLSSLDNAFWASHFETARRVVS